MKNEFVLIEEEHLLSHIREIIEDVFKENGTTNEKVEDRPLTPKETAKLFGISRQTLYTWLKKGFIKSSLVGRRRFFFMTEIMQHLKDSGKQSYK